ncbi:L-rhamnose mutarotase [Adlercreutzia sp.]|uniref:L-rhamnose mutarotase n=1 Tax=Adlercreutzia sp. TaxID=1872387 RepID=UPI003AABEF5D
MFGYIEIDDPERWAAGADTAINRKWWDFMADIMETNEDNSPVSVDLPVLFHMD